MSSFRSTSDRGARNSACASAISTSRRFRWRRPSSGVHLTYLVTPPPGADEPSLSPGDQARRAKIKQLQARQPSCQALHATRPQTISYALTDSTTGLLAWIAEKFTEWADPRSAITLDQILADVSIYWFPLPPPAPRPGLPTNPRAARCPARCRSGWSSCHTTSSSPSGP